MQTEIVQKNRILEGMTESIGKTLTEKRVQKGLSIEELSQLTRMNAKFIRAAEEDRFTDLPGLVFTKGLLRSCAKELGIDGDEILSRYESLGVEHVDNSPEFISMSLHRTQSNIPKFVILALLVLILLYSLAQLVNDLPVKTEGETPAPVTKEEVIVPSNAIPEPAPEPETSLPTEQALPDAEVDNAPAVETEDDEKVSDIAPAETEPINKPANAPSTDTDIEPEEDNRTEQTEKTEPPKAMSADESSPLQDTSRTYYLTIVAEEDSWIKVVVDGSITREIILREGNQTTWWANESYLLSIGNVAATRIFLDGVSVPIKQPASNIIKNLKLPRNVAAPSTQEEETEGL